MALVGVEEAKKVVSFYSVKCLTIYINLVLCVIIMKMLPEKYSKLPDLPRLTEEEELVCMISGDIEKLVLHNTRLVTFAVKRICAKLDYASPCLGYEELMAEGLWTLVDVATKYNGSTRFSTFAVTSLYYRLYNFIAKNKSIVKVTWQQKIAAKSFKVGKHSKIRTINTEVASESLASYEPAENEDAKSTPPELTVMPKFNESLDLSCLDEDEKLVITKKYWEDKSLSAVARELKIHRDYARRLEASAIKKLKHELKSCIK